jgi:SAM-dependent methyltransferase
MAIPDLPVDQQERRLHLERYEYAASVLRGKRVLDCACGMGYGTELMRRNGVEACGVDKDPDAIRLARERYPEAVYAVGDIYDVSFDGFDALVSFETLEHLDEPSRILDRLASSGVSEIIASVPIRPTVHVNPWHRTDFTPDSFRALIHRAYDHIDYDRGQLWSDGEDMYRVIHGKKDGQGSCLSR